MSVEAPARSDDRAPDELRPATIEAGFMRTATGSALISMGETRVICTASVQESVPRWMAGSGRGWVTAETDGVPHNRNKIRIGIELQKRIADARSRHDLPGNVVP